jgi:hypothetical protein
VATLRAAAVGLSTFAAGAAALGLSYITAWLIFYDVNRVLTPEESWPLFWRITTAASTFLAWCAISAAVAVGVNRRSAARLRVSEQTGLVIAAMMALLVSFGVLSLFSALNSCMWGVSFPLGFSSDLERCPLRGLDSRG